MATDATRNEHHFSPQNQLSIIPKISIRRIFTKKFWNPIIEFGIFGFLWKEKTNFTQLPRLCKLFVHECSDHLSARYLTWISLFRRETALSMFERTTRTLVHSVALSYVCSFCESLARVIRKLRDSLIVLYVESNAKIISSTVLLNEPYPEPILYCLRIIVALGDK